MQTADVNEDNVKLQVWCKQQTKCRSLGQSQDEPGTGPVQVKCKWPIQVKCIMEGDEDEGFLDKQLPNIVSLWFGPGPAVCFVFNVLIFFLFVCVSFPVYVHLHVC